MPPLDRPDCRNSATILAGKLRFQPARSGIGSAESITVGDVAGGASRIRALLTEDDVTDSKVRSKKAARKGKSAEPGRQDEAALPAGWPGRGAGRSHPAEEKPNPGGARGTSETGGQQSGGPGSPPFKRSDRANDGGSP